jgi:phosphonate transport system permease protein
VSTSAFPSRTLPADPAWRGRVTFIVLALALLWPMLVWSEFKPWILFDAQSLQASGQFLATFFPPAHSSDFLQLAAVATWQTVAIATAGMVLALLLAIPLTLIATERLSVSRLGTGRISLPGRMVRQAARWLLVLLRSVPELVWALLFVRIVGLGPTAGVLAIALTYGGMLGKVYAEILESTDAQATDALLRNGSGRLVALLYGTLPDAAPELVSYTVYRWECAIRGSVVMGFVGAGGLGQRMDESLKMLAGDEVATMLIVFVLLVGCADGVSKLLRSRLA